MAISDNTKRRYPKFSNYISRKRKDYGSKFSMADLAMKFVPYYESGDRIKVKMYGEEITGTVGISTGWRPVFLLIRRSNAYGSSEILKSGTRILGVKGYSRSYLKPRKTTPPKKSDFR